jgi:outer membrane protein assembly factor BamB
VPVAGPVAGPGAGPVEPVRTPAPPSPAAPQRAWWWARRWLLAGTTLAVLAGGTVAVWAGGDGGPGGEPTPSPATGPALLWRRDTGRSVTGSPAVARDVVLVGGSDGVIRALLRSDGGPAWTYRAGARVAVTPGPIGDVLYAASTDGTVHAVDAAVGKRLWTAPANTRLDAAPRVAGGAVVVGGRDGRVRTFELTGKEGWRYRTGGEIRSRPSAGLGLVFVATRDGRLYAIDAAGRRRWRTPVGEVASDTRQYAGTVCVGGSDGSVHCVNARDGKQHVRIDARTVPGALPSIGDGVVYTSDRTGTVAAWDARTGDRRWATPSAGGAPGPSFPLFNGRTVYVVGATGLFSALDAATGRPLWTLPTAGRFDHEPRIEGGVLYAADTNGAVYAVRPPPEPPTPAPPAPTRSGPGS